MADENGHLELLWWCRANGCPCEDEMNRLV
jgi:hypothetical protein